MTKQLRWFVSLFVGAIYLASDANALGGVWSPGAPLTTNRWHHTATLLNNGKVLIAGGLWANYQKTTNATTVFSTAELYDPVTSTSIPTASMLSPRYNHTATLLRDGRVLVTGGQLSDTGLLATTEIYDPTNGTWTAATSMGSARVHHSATPLENGSVLILGGAASAYPIYPANTGEIYDPVSTQWTAVPNYTNSNSYFTTTLLNDGRVLMVSYSSYTAQIFDPVAFSWKITTPPHIRRQYHAATLLPNGQVLISGGSRQFFSLPPDVAVQSHEIFDPATETWTLYTNSLHEIRVNHTSTLLANGSVVIAGGATTSYDQFGSPSTPLKSAEIYNPNTATWTFYSNALSAPRTEHSATLLANGKVLFTGAAGGASDIYDPTPALLTGSFNNGAFSVTFTNTAGGVFSLMAATNITLPLSAWTNVATATEVQPGVFQAQDSTAPGARMKFYSIQP